MSARTKQFPTGRLIGTPGVLDTVGIEEMVSAFNRHSKGDWGDVCPEDWRSNDRAIQNGGRIFSAYYVEFAMDLNEHIGYAWHLNTRINHKWASGIVLYTDENFCAEYELLEALLSIGSWFQHHLKRLRGIVEEEKGKRQMALTHPEVMAA